MIRRIWRSLQRRLWHRRELRIYRCEAGRAAALPVAELMRRDAPEDLAYFVPNELDPLPADAYRSLAAARLAQGHHLYTRVEGDQLVHYGWLIDHQERGEDEELGQVFFPPERSAALYDFYTHPAARRRGLYRQALSQAMRDAVLLGGARQLYIYIYSDNPGSARVAQSLGFEEVGRLVATRRLFVRRRYGIATTAGFRSGLLERPDR